MHLKILILLIAFYQITESKPYLNTRRLSFGEQMTWRFGGWKPMVASTTGLRPEDSLSGLASLINSSNNSNTNLINNNNNVISNSNSNLINNNNNHVNNFNNVIYSNNNNNSANGVVQNGRNVTSSSSSSGLSTQRASPNSPIGISSSAPLTPILTLNPSPTSLVSSSSSSSPQSPGSLASPDSSESHLAPKYRHLADVEQVKMDDIMGKSFPGSSGPSIGPGIHGLYGPPMGHGFGKPSYGFPGLPGMQGLKGRSILPGHLSYLSRGLPVHGGRRGPNPTRLEGKPMKDAELHAYRVIKQLKERGRDIRKDFGIVDAFPVNRGLYPKVTTGEGGKRYVTVPVAIETDHDKVLTQNDIKDIEKEVLKIIPEVEHGLVEGAVKDGARVIELRPDGEKGGRSINRPSVSVTSPSSTGRIPGHSSVIAGPSPIIYDNLAANPIKSRISSIFRPLLSKFRQPSRSPPAYGSNDPKNLNVIHLIAHQDRHPSVVPIDMLAQRPDLSNNNNNNNQGGHRQQSNKQRYPMAPNPISPPMSNLQYKIIHPPNNNQGQSGKAPFIEYNQPPQHHYEQQSGPVAGPPQSQQSPPPYQVIDIPRGYDGSPDHLIETPPQVVPINEEQLVDLKANHYNHGDQEPQPGHGPIQYNQSPTPGPVQMNYRPTSDDGYSEPPHPTTGSPGANYDSGSYAEDDNNRDNPANQGYNGNNNGDNNGNNNGNSGSSGYNEPQANSQDNYGNNEHSPTDYPSSLGPEYNLNAHSGQIERPANDYSTEENDNNRERVNNDGADQGSQEHRPTLTPSVDYAEAPKIELLNGASPDFSPKPFTTPSEFDTKMLINLISNQIPSLGNVLKDGESSKENDGARAGNQDNYGEQHQQGGYNVNDQRSSSYEIQNEGKNHNNDEQSGQGYGTSGYPRETFTEAAVNHNEPRFGDRIRGQEVIYAKAEHFDDQNYQSNSQQGLYQESSNSQEVRVKSDNTTSNREDEDDEETYTFVKLDHRDKPINGKVIFGNQPNNQTSVDKSGSTSESAQMYHAYYGSADHVPPPGYIKLSDNEFKEIFKDADILYSKDRESNDPLSSSSSETSPSSSISVEGSNIDKTTIEDSIDVTTIKSTQENEQSSKS